MTGMKRESHRTIFLRVTTKESLDRRTCYTGRSCYEWKELLVVLKKKINHFNGQREVSKQNLGKVKYKEFGSIDSRKIKLMQSSCEKKKKRKKCLMAL